MKEVFIIKDCEDYSYFQNNNNKEALMPNWTERIECADQFDTYPEAVEVIKQDCPNGVYQIEKIFIVDIEP